MSEGGHKKDIEKISQELKPTLPLDTPNDPVYIDIVDGHVIVPQLEFQKTTYEPKSSENASQSNVPQTVTATVSTCQEETYDDEDEDDNQVGKRFDWKISATRKLLTILVDKKKENSDFVLSKKVWPEVADHIKQATIYRPSATQCREKFYSLKRSYRHFLMESKKTGNRRPKPFIFESEMQIILESDPAFKPVVMKSSFGAREINNNVADTDDEIEDNDGEETASTSSSRSSTPNSNQKSKGKKRKVDELKEYLTERDKEFFKKMSEMQEKTNAILEKLVEKL